MMKKNIIETKIENSVGKTIKVILKSNGWKFEGKLIMFDEKYIELLDFVSNSTTIISIDDLNSMEAKE